MAAEIYKSFGIECTLIPKGRGIFDVDIDGTLIYSKYETGRFPEASEIIETIRQMDGGNA